MPSRNFLKTIVKASSLGPAVCRGGRSGADDATEVKKMPKDVNPSHPDLFKL
jgi:hypothetical protein